MQTTLAQISLNWIQELNILCILGSFAPWCMPIALDYLRSLLLLKILLKNRMKCYTGMANI